MFSLEVTWEDLQGASLASERDAGAPKVPRPASPALRRRTCHSPGLGSQRAYFRQEEVCEDPGRNNTGHEAYQACGLPGISVEGGAVSVDACSGGFRVCWPHLLFILYSATKLKGVLLSAAKAFFLCLAHCKQWIQMINACHSAVKFVRWWKFCYL